MPLASNIQVLLPHTKIALIWITSDNVVNANFVRLSAIALSCCCLGDSLKESSRSWLLLLMK